MILLYLVAIGIAVTALRLWRWRVLGALFPGADLAALDGRGLPKA